MLLWLTSDAERTYSEPAHKFIIYRHRHPHKHPYIRVCVYIYEAEHEELSVTSKNFWTTLRERSIWHLHDYAWLPPFCRSSKINTPKLINSWRCKNTVLRKWDSTSLAIWYKNKIVCCFSMVLAPAMYNIT